MFHEPMVLYAPMRVDSRGGALSVLGEESVSTPAGSFQGCVHLFLIESAGAGTDSWFCPGVGFVRYESWSCYTNGNELSILQLTDWSGR